MFVTDPIGIKGEEEATKMMEKKGFHVVEHNWRMGHLEVDLIAENKKEIVLVEVKARTTTFGEWLPEEYVDENKKKRMTIAGNAYLKYRHSDKSLRFDIIGILVDPDTMKVSYRNHLENIFQPTARTITSGSHSSAWLWRKKKK